MFVFVRSGPDTFSSAILASGFSRDDVCVAEAIRQHRAYVSALRAIEIVDRVIELPAIPHLPDSCFVEDSAVLVDSSSRHFMLPSSNAPTRRQETEIMAHDLRANSCSFTDWAGPLDGGDVLRVCSPTGGRSLVFVGLSDRTTAESIAALSELMPESSVCAVKVPESLHLKTITTWISTSTDVDTKENACPGFFVAPRTPEGVSVIECVLGHIRDTWKVESDISVCWLREEDRYAANTLQVGHNVLMPEGFPAAFEAVQTMLSRHGVSSDITVAQVPMSEFRKANGALTCLSIVV